MRSYRFQRGIEGYSTVVEPPYIVYGQYPILFLGSYERAVKYLLSNRNYFTGFTKMKERLVCLIAQEIEANRAYVDFPVDVIEMKYGSHKWYYDNKKCTIAQ